MVSVSVYNLTRPKRGFLQAVHSSMKSSVENSPAHRIPTMNHRLYSGKRLAWISVLGSVSIVIVYMLLGKRYRDHYPTYFFSGIPLISPLGVSVCPQTNALYPARNKGLYQDIVSQVSSPRFKDVIIDQLVGAIRIRQVSSSRAITPLIPQFIQD